MLRIFLFFNFLLFTTCLLGQVGNNNTGNNGSIDFEYPKCLVCADGVTLMKIETVQNGTTVLTQFFGENGALIPASSHPKVYDLGACYKCPIVDPTHRTIRANAAGNFTLIGDVYAVQVYNDSEAIINVRVGGVHNVQIPDRRASKEFSNDECKDEPLGNTLTITNLNGGTINNTDLSIFINYYSY